MLALLLTGCLELEQKIVLAADGSAVFTYIYDIPNENLPVIEGYFASLTPANNSFLSAATNGRPKTTARQSRSSS